MSDESVLGRDDEPDEEQARSRSLDQALDQCWDLLWRLHPVVSPGGRAEGCPR